MSTRDLALFRAVVEEVREGCHAPNSVPALQHDLLNDFLDRITTPELHLYVLANGANPLLRKVLKASNAGQGADERQMQLAAWPGAEMRALVARINHSAVFVPSLGEFVDLLPDALSINETLEAGQYLLAQADDTRRRGDLLIELAHLRSRHVDPPPNRPRPPTHDQPGAPA